MGKREILKWIFIGIFAGLLILAALGGWMHWKNSPKRVVEKFVKAVQKEKWEKAWECLKLPDSPFLTSETLGGVLEKGPMAGMKGFRVKMTGEMEFTVSYEGSEGQEEEIVFQTEEDGRDGIWKGWTIVSPRFWAEDIQVEAYSSLKVQVDGILLTEEEEASREENTVTYQIPYLFLGTHEVETLGEDEGLKDTVKETVINQDGQMVIAEAGDVTEETLEDLKERTRQIWQECLDGMLESETPEFIIQSEEERWSSQIYNPEGTLLRAFDSMKSDYGGFLWLRLKELKLLDLDVQAEEVGYQEGILWVRVRAEGRVYRRWRKPVPGDQPWDEKKLEEEEERSFTVIYAKEEGEWRVMDFDGA